MDQPKVSVCVPVYERPEMSRELIESFRRQDLPAKERCIADDEASDAVEQLVARDGIDPHYVQEFLQDGHLVEALDRATPGTHLRDARDDRGARFPAAISSRWEAISERRENRSSKFAEGVLS
jgi:glycosyltransferase involved in cell wall biosynthesis